MMDQKKKNNTQKSDIPTLRFHAFSNNQAQKQQFGVMIVFMLIRFGQAVLN